MSTIFAYLNGQYLPVEDAKISPMDRGFLFGDGIYEVLPVYDGKIFGLNAHLDRLNLSLKGIRMEPTISHSEWKIIFESLVAKNGMGDQWIYGQVTRGVDPIRNQEIQKIVKPTIFAVSYPKVWPTKAEQSIGLRVTGVKDIRWKYCHIKTIARIAYILMFQEAKDGGFDEGIIMNTSYAFEGTSSNLFIVRHGVIYTPPQSSQLLNGITRDVILSLAEKNKIPHKKTKISERDLLKADEMWITSSGRGVCPVIEYNGIPIGNGKAGPLWARMWDLFENETREFSLSISH